MVKVVKVVKGEKILTCFLLVVVGYYIAKMFNKSCNGFRVGGLLESSDYYEPNNCELGRTGIGCLGYTCKTTFLGHPNYCGLDGGVWDGLVTEQKAPETLDKSNFRCKDEDMFNTDKCYYQGCLVPERRWDPSGIWSKMSLGENLKKCKSIEENNNLLICNDGEVCSNGLPCPTKFTIHDIWNTNLYNTSDSQNEITAEYGFCKIPSGKTPEEYEKTI